VVDFTFEGGVAELAIGEASVGDIRLQVGGALGWERALAFWE
jgi:hypothetical protein